MRTYTTLLTIRLWHTQSSEPVRRPTCSRSAVSCTCAPQAGLKASRHRHHNRPRAPHPPALPLRCATARRPLAAPAPRRCRRPPRRRRSRPAGTSAGTRASRPSSRPPPGCGRCTRRTPPARGSPWGRGTRRSPEVTSSGASRSFPPRADRASGRRRPGPPGTKTRCGRPSRWSCTGAARSWCTARSCPSSPRTACPSNPSRS
mmetsp:Transcript_24973/g.60078  ORF Transcript_24973/g.60078 Transcript_24973/m.60078 type:complete len:203 (-) Transcript_24973:1393-2001(-)